MRSLSFVDLFSGCGGLSLGLSLSGMRGRFAVERDPMAFQTFSANFLGGGVPSIQFQWPSWLPKGAIGIDELLQKHGRQLTKLRGEVDVLAGGPPCQGFSFAGRRQEDDPRNRLFEKYVEVVAAIRPRALILENVPGMRVAHTRGNVVDIGTPPTAGANKKSFYERLAESLEEAGYRVEASLVDASGFGVPQRRKRLIAIGIRKDLALQLDGGAARVFALLERSRLAQLAELSLSEKVSVRDAISDLETGSVRLVECKDPESPRGFMEAPYLGPQTVYQIIMQGQNEGPPNSLRLARHREDVRSRFLRIISECPKGVKMSDADRAVHGLKKHRIFPMAGDEMAPTVTTLPDDILHYSEPRILTVRECARLQSFPDWFAFKGKFTTGGDRRTRECPRYTQVGNAVPPLLARAIGGALTLALAEIELSLSRQLQEPSERKRVIAATA